MSEARIYASDAQTAPDSDFAGHGLRYLVTANRGRLRDTRRTPVTIVEVAPERGSFSVRIDAFEDVGAQWELSLSEIERFQFANDAAAADDHEVAALERSRARFDENLVIECEDRPRTESLERLGRCREQAKAWFHERAPGLRVDVDAHIERREGHARLHDLLDEFLAERELVALEEQFSSTMVSNPRAGEVVKGHCIVLAELGLCAYRGKIPRDPDLFTGSWSRARRADHILWRLAFTQELWRFLGRTDLVLFRAAATDGQFSGQRPSSVVSATFSRAVAEEHFAGGPATRMAVLWRQSVPIDRAFMTFLETRAMNQQFKEAEALLLVDPNSNAF